MAKKDILDIIKDDNLAGYKQVRICAKGCQNCAYASNAQDFRPRGHTGDWPPGASWHMYGVKEHDGIEMWCSQLGQWMREEYWSTKENCGNYQPRDFKKQKRVVICLKPIWKN
jgi:hypothetical protein